ncbi:unnamed protein product [Pocillopora meandrina]|uniref:Gag protein n=1 Tax=Pocillopora meandrina TaxID=46732 RepID=A0AAU9VZV2_9CNID|nr:unnamed protein product [Pocillopora meandrina]
MTQLKNKKKSRAGYKGYLSYAFSEEALREQLEKVTTLSNQILTLMEADDESTEEDMSMVVHDTNKLRFEVKLRLSAIGKLLATNLPNEPPPSSPSPSRKTSMHTGKQINCDFCLGGHNHEECKKVKNVHERKQSLGRGKVRKFG